MTVTQFTRAVQSRLALLLQMGLTLLILAFVKNTYIELCLLLPLWSLTLFNAGKTEWALFGLINIFFIVNDYLAIQNGFFAFTQPDFMKLPYFEFLIWGYYVLHAHKFLNTSYPEKHDWKVIIAALLFSQLFGLVSDFTLLLVLTSAFLMGLLLLYRKKDDLIFVTYMCVLGTVVEFTGVQAQIWHYPNRDFSEAALQFIVMWGAVGFFFRRIAGPFLSKAT